MSAANTAQEENWSHIAESSSWGVLPGPTHLLSPENDMEKSTHTSTDAFCGECYSTVAASWRLKTIRNACPAQNEKFS